MTPPIHVYFTCYRIFGLLALLHFATVALAEPLTKTNFKSESFDRDPGWQPRDDHHVWDPQ